MNKHKLYILLLAGFLVLTIFIISGENLGIFSQNERSTKSHSNPLTIQTNSSAPSDSLKQAPTTIVGYLIGNEPEGFDAVLKEVNVRLKNDLNAKLEIHYLSWADHRTKYPLILAAQENIDFIFTADWCMYNQEAAKNAFYEITQEDLKQYMPQHYLNCSPKAYDEASLNDKVYMIPSSTPDERITCLLYRKDLAHKYGVDNLNRLSDFTAYFQAIAEHETSILPMKLSASYDSLWIFLANEYSTEITLTNGLCYYSDTLTPTIAPLYKEPYADALHYAFQTMKNWYDAGYVNRDVLANETTSAQAFEAGSSAIAIGNSIDLQNLLAICKEKGYDVGIVPLLDAKGKASRVSYVNNGVAITAFSKNPTLTMRVLDLIMENKEYNFLTYFGIQGVNYTITKDGEIGLPSGVTNATNTYPMDASGFWFSNKKQYPPIAFWPDEYIALQKKIPTMLYENPPLQLNFDLTPIQTESLQVNDVILQYMQPMSYGIVDNIDSSMKLLEDKLKDAGIEKIDQYIQKQLKTNID